jgi:uncharacterized protein YndB with AHSA1/START domain
MPDILHDLPIDAPQERVFQAICTPEGLDEWWTKECQGKAGLGETYRLGFGPDYDWSAVVERYQPQSEFALKLVKADADWLGTVVGIQLEPRKGSGTWVRFSHLGWPVINEHYRVSCNCWASYLRILRRYLEHGERVPYDDRLNV